MPSLCVYRDIRRYKYASTYLAMMAMSLLHQQSSAAPTFTTPLRVYPPKAHPDLQESAAEVVDSVGKDASTTHVVDST